VPLAHRSARRAAAAQGNIEAIEQHLSAGADVNAGEPTAGSTPLMVAALFDQAEPTAVLIENAADINARNSDGSTALIIASFFCCTNTVKLLSGKGADVNLKNAGGQTALEIVAGS